MGATGQNQRKVFMLRNVASRSAKLLIAHLDKKKSFKDTKLIELFLYSLDINPVDNNNPTLKE